MICVTVLLLLVFHPLLMKKLMVKGYELLVKCRLMKRQAHRYEKLDDSMELYCETADFLKNHIRVMVFVFLADFRTNGAFYGNVFCISFLWAGAIFIIGISGFHRHC